MMLAVGPSPRIRGKSTTSFHMSITYRTIPANTGKIPAKPQTWITIPDHPREYGENARGGNGRHNRWGPSPRIRGKCATTHFTAKPTGTIPANTGKITPLPWTWQGYGDHPREYGENRMVAGCIAHAWGPSPRIRGKFVLQRNIHEGVGTIPANTGKIRRLMLIPPAAWDHPREYGENPASIPRSWPATGPSPRIRGK